MPIVAAFMLPHPPIILSEIGRGEEEKIALTRQSYERVADEIAELAPETIIISSPHTVMYGDYFHISPGRGAKGDEGLGRAPLGKVGDHLHDLFVRAGVHDVEAGVERGEACEVLVGVHKAGGKHACAQVLDGAWQQHRLER